MKKTSFILTISLCLFGLSCSKENTPIPVQFQKYVDSFIVEAQKRGKKYDIKKLKISLSDNVPVHASGQAQLGSYNVEIDRTKWKEYEDSGSEIIKESLIYHELGHAILNRVHKNDILPDGSSASIMCGRDYTINCSVAYGGMRKKYYLDELFDENTPTPDWADYSNFKDEYLGNKRLLIVSEEFDDFKNFESTKPANATIKNGILNIEAGSNIQKPFIELRNFLPYFTIPEENIEIEVRFSVIQGTITVGWTPVFENPTDGYLLTFNTKQTSQLNLSLNSAIYNTTISKPIDNLFLKNDFNVLTMRRINNDVYFFLNNKIVYISDLIEVATPYITVNNQNLYWLSAMGVFSGNCQLDYIRVNRIIL
jgi:hypothetical protein